MFKGGLSAVQTYEHVVGPKARDVVGLFTRQFVPLSNSKLHPATRQTVVRRKRDRLVVTRARLVVMFEFGTRQLGRPGR